VKTWDAVVIGGGVIGLSIALALRKHGAEVLVAERGEPGREASTAAGGILSPYDPHTPPALLDLALASLKMYAEFVHEVEDESGTHVDFRRHGSVVFTVGPMVSSPAVVEVEEVRLTELEPTVSYRSRAFLLDDASVDPRALMDALLKSAKHRRIQLATGAEVIGLHHEDGRTAGVRTAKTHFISSVVINCAGAWAGEVPPHRFPTRPVKGQMLSVIAPHRQLIQRIVRADDVYLVPRSDGRIVIGSTQEEAGFDKRVDADTVHRLHQLAANLVPDVGEGKILEFWAGLRPGTPDDLPILGATPTPGYFVATGHFRNGILLAPVTAQVMAKVVRGASPEFDISPFSPMRFAL
jgi:glycine oxidase